MLSLRMIRFASFWAAWTDSSAISRRCLAFWVLFALSKFAELLLGNLLLRIPCWHHMRGTATLLLVVPGFSGAFNVYINFVKPYLLESACLSCFFSQLEDPNGDGDGESSMRITDKEDTSSLLPSIWSIEGEREAPEPGDIQKEWSCSLCLVSTTSENSLKEHLNGKKHKSKDEYLRDIQSKKVPIKTEESGFSFSSLMNNGIWTDLLYPRSTSIYLKWEKPERGWIKLNTDGSVGENKANMGGLLRNFKGNPLCAFVSRAPHGDIFMVEMLAVWRGLVLALNMGIKAIWVESDSMSVVKTINKDQLYSGEGEGCLKRIWKLLKKFQKHQVSHSFRETNRAADYLSKMAADKQDVVLPPGKFPKGLWKIIRDDLKGKEYQRRRRSYLPWP